MVEHIKRIALALAMMPTSALAKTPTLFSDPVNSEPAKTAEALVAFINTVKNIIMGTAGIIAVAMIIYGGILYVVAGGDEDKIKNAKQVLYFAVIGIAIVVSAQVLVVVVIKLLGGNYA